MADEQIAVTNTDGETFLLTTDSTGTANYVASSPGTHTYDSVYAERENTPTEVSETAPVENTPTITGLILSGVSDLWWLWILILIAAYIAYRKRKAIKDTLGI